MEQERRFAEVMNATIVNLRGMLHHTEIRELTQMELPEIEQVVDDVARLVPAGNVPGMILNGLARVSGRKLPPDNAQRDVRTLFRGVEMALDRAVFGAFFAGPAAVIWGYQSLLTLVGKDVESAFPEGTWQFYVDYALREDTARHANETDGFDRTLQQYTINLEARDRITAWVLAAITLLHEYDELLANEWHERVACYVLREVTREQPFAVRFARLYRQWEKQRPYRLGPEASAYETYPRYRRGKFERFLDNAMLDLPPDLRQRWQHELAAIEAEDLPRYQAQMSMLSTLEPGTYGDTRRPIPLREAKVGLYVNGHYYLISACAPGTDHPPEPATVRAQVDRILSDGRNRPAARLVGLARVQRRAQASLRERLGSVLRDDLAALGQMPLLLNFDAAQHPAVVNGGALSDLRQAERGLGDHPLTIFDVGGAFVFDQSHIYFDGTWGAALAEIMTNEALRWVRFLVNQPQQAVEATLPASPSLEMHPAEALLVQGAPTVTAEVSVENDQADLRAVSQLRMLLGRRNRQLHLTVNDLLLLYRAIHAATYQPSRELLVALDDLKSSGAGRKLHRNLREVLVNRENPALLIPVDASIRSPRERLHPMSFEVPLNELELLTLHTQAVDMLENVPRGRVKRRQHADVFAEVQRAYLAALGAFGAVFHQARDNAMLGETSSVKVLKMMAHIPTRVRHTLEKIPESIDMLNDLIKGREVFSNVGRVAPNSSLRRFITAKDDNDKKTMCWGVLSDAQGVMRVSLRDFRPHVSALIEAGRRDLAVLIAQDYLDSYVSGFNRYVAELERVVLAGRDLNPSGGEGR